MEAMDWDLFIQVIALAGIIFFMLAILMSMFRD